MMLNLGFAWDELQTWCKMRVSHKASFQKCCNMPVSLGASFKNDARRAFRHRHHPKMMQNEPFASGILPKCHKMSVSVQASFQNDAKWVFLFRHPAQNGEKWAFHQEIFYMSHPFSAGGFLRRKSCTRNWLGYNPGHPLPPPPNNHG